MSATSISSFLWAIAQDVLRGASVRVIEQSEIKFRRWIIDTKPHPRRAPEEVRADILMIDHEPEGLQAGFVGGTT